jgi:hypothetical protein
MALAMTRALSLVAPDIASVNCLNIYFISESLVTHLLMLPRGHHRLPVPVAHAWIMAGQRHRARRDQGRAGHHRHSPQTHHLMIAHLVIVTTFFT